MGETLNAAVRTPHELCTEFEYVAVNCPAPYTTANLLTCFKNADALSAGLEPRRRRQPG